MIKSSQGTFSTVPKLQAKEKHSATLSELYWPIHHCCLNALNNNKNTVRTSGNNHVYDLVPFQTMISVSSWTYLWFHGARQEYSGLRDVQQEQFYQLHSYQRWKSYSELCPQWHVGASLEIPTDLQNKVRRKRGKKHIKIFCFLSQTNIFTTNKLFPHSFKPVSLTFGDSFVCFVFGGPLIKLLQWRLALFLFFVCLLYVIYKTFIYSYSVPDYIRVMCILKQCIILHVTVFNYHPC